MLTPIGDINSHPFNVILLNIQEKYHCGLLFMNRICSNGSNLSIVIQGAVDNQNITNILSSYRRFLPESEIILSTWDVDSHANYPYVDRCVRSVDPGPLICSVNGVRLESNVNRQILSSNAGILLADREFCLKTRSDIYLANSGFIEYYNKYSKTNHTCDDGAGFFLLSNISSKDPNFIYPAPLHLCDWFILSDLNSMKALFDVDLLTAEAQKIKLNNGQNRVYSALGVSKVRWSAETYLWRSYLNRFFNFEMNSEFDNNQTAIRMHEHFLRNHCVVLENEMICIKTFKSIYKRLKGVKLIYEYSFNDWKLQSLSCKLNRITFFTLLFRVRFWKAIKYLCFKCLQFKRFVICLKYNNKNV